MFHLPRGLFWRKHLFTVDTLSTASSKRNSWKDETESLHWKIKKQGVFRIIRILSRHFHNRAPLRDSTISHRMVNKNDSKKFQFSIRFVFVPLFTLSESISFFSPKLKETVNINTSCYFYLFTALDYISFSFLCLLFSQPVFTEHLLWARHCCGH